MHSQNYCVGSMAERHLYALRAAVLDRILKGFLQNAKDAKGDFLRQVFRNVLGVEVNFNFVLAGKFAAIAGGGDRQSQNIRASRSGDGAIEPACRWQDRRQVRLLS